MPGTLRRIAVVGGAPQPVAGLEVIDAAAILQAEGEPEPLERPILPWDTQSMIYTSGTTGPSKGVLCSYMHYTSSGMAFPFVRQGDRGLVTLPLFHMGGTGSVYRYLLRGASIVVAESFRTQTFWEVVRRNRITCASLLGAMTSFLVKAPPSPQDRDHTLRALTIVPLTEEAAIFRERFGVEVWTTFNMTEIACAIFSEANPTRVGSCGRPRPGITARIVDDNDCEVPVGAVGELALRSDAPWSMNHGYHRNPEATARAWRNGWFHTGDAFRRDADGEFFFVDRMKDAIRRRGENISSFEVEAEICAHPSVREAAVVAVPSEFAEDEVLAVVAPVPGAVIDPAALIEFLAPRLPHFMVPRYLRIMAELPKTLTSKVEKHVLRAEGLSRGYLGPREGRHPAAARTPGRGGPDDARAAALPVVADRCRPGAGLPRTRPPRLVAGFSAGGTLDIVARLMAEGMSPLLGQRVVVENRPGANGLIAAEGVARGPADGYALLVCPMGTMTISPQLPGAALPIDPSKDLVPVANMIAAQHAMVVAGTSPWRSVAEVVDAAHRPGRARSATPPPAPALASSCRAPGWRG